MPKFRKRGEIMENAYHTHHTLAFSDELEIHIKTLADFINLGKRAPNKAVQEAIDYFDINAVVDTDSDSYDAYEDLYAINPTTSYSERNNPSKNPDFFDLIRTLSQTMKLLSDAIEAKNDRQNLPPDIKAVRAYIKSFDAFLDDREADLTPEKIPDALPKGLVWKLSQVKDWYKISESARNWAETIIKIVDKIMSIGGTSHT